MTSNVDKNNNHDTGMSGWALLISGGMAFITGVLVIAGWYLALPSLIRLYPAFPAMAFNAALLLTVSGAGLFAYGRRHPRLTTFCGGLVAVAGFLTLIQYFFGINLHIDQLFIEDRFAVRAPYPGRMAPNAALAFILTGLALLMLGTPAHHPQRYKFLGVAGSLLAILVLVSPVAYLMSGEMTALSWGRIVGPDMSPHLSFGLIAVGTGFVVYAWLQDRDAEIAMPSWFPLMVGIAMLAGALVVWQALREREFLNAENIVKSQVTDVAGDVRLELDAHVKRLLRMARRWEARGRMPRAEWESDVRLYEQHVPGYAAIEWVDPRFHVRWSVPAEKAAPPPPEEKRPALLAAGQRREIRIMPETVTGGAGIEKLLVYVPFASESGFTGYIRGVLDVQEIFDAIFSPELLLGYAIAVFKDDREIYRRGDGGEGPSTPWARDASLEMYGINLRLRVWPVSAPATALLQSRIPETILGLGTLLSLILALTANLAQKSWRRARLLQKTNLSLSNEIVEHRQALDMLEKSEGRYRDLMEHAADGIFIADTSGNLLDVNRRVCEMTGHAREELLRLNARNLFTPEDLAARPMRFPEVLSGQTVIIERPLLRRDGTTLPVEVNVKLIGNRLQAIIRDIGARREAELQMRKLSGAIQRTADPVIITDALGTIEYVNPAFETMTGYSLDEVRGKTPRVLKSGRHDKEFYQRLWGAILNGEPFHEVFINRRKGGALYYEEKTITPLKDEHGRITHFISTGKNIAEHQHVQERLLHLTQHDILTQLPNRALFMERLARAVARTRWNRKLLAVLLFDIDGLGAVNNTLGHEVGDRLLQLIAERLDECMRDQDTVARLSGGEFGIILEDASTLNEVSLATRKIRLALSLPYPVDGQEVSATVSIGISLYPEDGEDAPTLVRNAAVAISRAREQGKNNFGFYQTNLNARITERLHFEMGLRRALEQKEFLLHYQPQMDLKTKRICGLEALLCWQHPQRGLPAPHDFLPLLEETGLIVPVGAWMLRTACEQNNAWQATGLPAIPVAVKVFYLQLGEPDYTDLVALILEETGLAPHFLQLEISDRILSREARVTQEILRTLNAKGIEIVADDFIVGESSLRYLKRLPVGVLKLDASFLLREPDDAEDAVLTDAIISIAHKQQLRVIADGVETEPQLRFFQAAGCDVVQGRVFSQPMPAIEVTRLLQNGKPAKR